MPRETDRGSLPDELRAAAAELIAERGPASFSLREVARRAGVSHAAPGHHFGDSRGLLTSVAVEGWRMLHRSMLSRIAGIEDPERRLAELGAAYLDFSREQRGHYGVMVTMEYSDHDDPKFIEASMACFDLMQATVSEIAPNAERANANALSIIMWATAHGLAEISPVLDRLAELSTADRVSGAELLRSAARIAVESANR